MLLWDLSSQRYPTSQNSNCCFSVFKFNSPMSVILSYWFTMVDNDKFISAKKVFKLLFWGAEYPKSMHHFFLEVGNSTHIVSGNLVSNFGSLLVIKPCLVSFNPSISIFSKSWKLVITYFQVMIRLTGI